MLSDLINLAWRLWAWTAYSSEGRPAMTEKERLQRQLWDLHSMLLKADAKKRAKIRWELRVKDQQQLLAQQSTTNVILLHRRLA